MKTDETTPETTDVDMKALREQVREKALRIRTTLRAGRAMTCGSYNLK
jgi:hypothetical protein